MPKPTGPTDLRTKEIIRNFKKKDKFYLSLARLLAKSTRSKSPVNVTKIGKISRENDTVAVPGKVLGSGEIKKPVNVYALSFSREAEKKINAAGGRCFPLENIDKKARIVV